MLRRCVLLMITCAAATAAPGCALLKIQESNTAAMAARGIAYVADGSGDLRQVADALAAVTEESHPAMRVERVQWSHGKGAVFPDLYDADRQQAQGQALANKIVAYRKAHPADRICLVGYSSGASVALAAAEHLPAGTIDRLILLAPTVAAKHDLRPALSSSREGIDAFHSEWDVICAVLFAMGTGDGAGKSVAGRGGFVQVGESKQDELLYKGLRQHFWQGAERWSGHDGGHFGCFNRDFLRAQVLPKLLGQS